MSGQFSIVSRWSASGDCGRYLARANVRRTDCGTSPLRRAFTKTEFAVVLAICGVLFAILYPVIQNARNPKGPYGKIYPKVPPAEDRRITHPTGLSIIAPVNWDQIRDQGSNVPFLCVSCRGYPGARLRSWITIRDSGEPTPTQLADLTKTQFNAHPAFHGMRVEPTNADGGLSIYHLYVDTGQQWWYVAYSLADETTMLSPSIKEYIDTIVFPDGQITKP